MLFRDCDRQVQCAGNPTLASASWDRTVRLWDTYSGNRAAAESLLHAHEVLALALHPTGKYLVCSTLNGELHFWDAQEAAIVATIEVQHLPLLF